MKAVEGVAHFCVPLALSSWGDRSVRMTQQILVPTHSFCLALLTWVSSRLVEDRCLTIRGPVGLSSGPGPLPFFHSDSNAQMRGLGMFAGPRGCVSSFGFPGPRTDWSQWSDSAPWPWERDEAVVGQWRRWPHSRDRVWSWAGQMETHPCSSLGPRRKDKDGSGCLDTGSGPGGGWLFLLFVEENSLEQRSLQILQIGQPFNENLSPSPPIVVLCLYTAAGSQIPLCSITLPLEWTLHRMHLHYQFHLHSFLIINHLYHNDFNFPLKIKTILFCSSSQEFSLKYS